MTRLMLPVHQLLTEITAALRNVIAPAVAEPYPKAQAYMAAVILEFVARQVEERRDIPEEKEHTLHALFADLTTVLTGEQIPAGGEREQEARLCRLIEWLYAEKERLGPEAFEPANQRIRQALRALLDEELKVAGNKKGA
jgi:hypothetical protein